MKWGIFALVAFMAVGATFASDVVVIEGQEQFDKVVGEASAIVVEFYAPWCGHCKKLAPEYEEAAGQLKDDGIVLANVDATLDSNKALASKFGVRGYPTLKIFRNGDTEKGEEYNGPREAAGIVSYLSGMFGPASKTLTSADETAKLIEGGLAVIAVLKDEESDFAKLYMKIAESLREEADFGHTTDASVVAKCEGMTCEDTILLFKTFDEPELVYEGEAEEAAFKSWLDKATTPVMAELSKDPANRRALQKIFANPAPKFLGMAKADDANLDAFKAGMRAVAEKHSDKISFLFAEAGENAGALGFFGLTEDDMPGFAIHDGEKNAKFSKGSADIADLEAWIDSFVAGTLEKTVKSEPVPETNDDPVKVVVASEFDAMVFGGQDVMVEFYAPWCGHCKKLAPVYEEVAQEFESEPNVIIAKMDATANDIPSDKFDVKGFPTIYFVKGSTGEVLLYEGDRSKDSLIQYVKKNASPSEEAPKEGHDEL